MQSDDEHKGLIEAALFMSSEPLTIEQLSKITGVNSLGYVKGKLLELRNEYQNRGIHVAETPEGWLFRVDRKHTDKVASLTPYADIPEGQKRTLALIAYKEPIAQSEIIKIQGNKSYSYIKALIRRGLVKSERHKRTRMLSLTQEFERYFGADKNRIREQMIEKFGKISSNAGAEKQGIRPETHETESLL